jgi:peptide/nickel transport system permease protein
MRHSWVRVFCILGLAAVVVPAVLAGLWAHSYQEQFRERPNAAPSHAFLLGTDELGRDRFVRLLYGCRVSLLVAPAASLLAVATAAVVGGLAGWLGGFWRRLVNGATDVALALPWLLLLLAVRTSLPLDISPLASAAVTFALLGLFGWVGPAKVVSAGVAQVVASDFVLAARGRGVGAARIFAWHVVPHLRPVLVAQFWTTLPAFILAEANLSLLGLGVVEPLPSLGNMLRELETVVAGWDHPWSRWWTFAPAFVLVLVVASVQGLLPREELS